MRFADYPIEKEEYANLVDQFLRQSGSTKEEILDFILETKAPSPQMRKLWHRAGARLFVTEILKESVRENKESRRVYAVLPNSGKDGGNIWQSWGRLTPKESKVALTFLWVKCRHSLSSFLRQFSYINRSRIKRNLRKLDYKEVGVSPTEGKVLDEIREEMDNRRK